MAIFFTIFLRCSIFSYYIYVNSFFFTFIDFYGKTIKPMLPSMKFQNGAQIQDGRQNVFIV
jgi:hypothetical protein